MEGKMTSWCKSKQFCELLLTNILSGWRRREKKCHNSKISCVATTKLLFFLPLHSSIQKHQATSDKELGLCMFMSAKGCHLQHP